MKNKITIGFIGQGYVGKNYADDFEKRGFRVTRYALENGYSGNRDKIKDCDVVFIAVPTPTTPKGFSYSIIESVLKLIGKGKIAVIKSTILPGVTEILQKKFSKIIILNSPEFLSEKTAAHDAANPFSNIVGIPINSEKCQKAAKLVHEILPKSPFSLTCKSKEAELIKYAHNGSGYTQIIFFNTMYDLARTLKVDWQPIENAILADPMICNRYAKPLHKSGRGAGGNCFIKDFAALSRLYKKMTKDALGSAVLSAQEAKNIDLLTKSKKDLLILHGVYGDLPALPRRQAGGKAGKTKSK